MTQLRCPKCSLRIAALGAPENCPRCRLRSGEQVPLVPIAIFAFDPDTATPRDDATRSEEIGEPRSPGAER